MVPVEVRQQPHVSFTQLDQYLRCPLRYRFLYIDRLEPDFVPAARAFGSGIHAAAAVFFRGIGQGERPTVEDVQGYFETFWKLETDHQPLRYGEKESKESLLDLARRMLAVLCEQFTPGTEVLAVEQPFAVPLIDQATGDVLDRDPYRVASGDSGSTAAPTGCQRTAVPSDSLNECSDRLCIARP